MLFDDLPRDRQPETDPAKEIVPASIKMVEAIKDARHIFLGDADAMVLHRNNHLVVLLAHVVDQLDAGCDDTGSGFSRSFVSSEAKRCLLDASFDLAIDNTRLCGDRESAPISPADRLGSQGSASLRFLARQVVVAYALATDFAELVDLPTDSYGSASAIFSPRLWSGLPLPLTDSCSIPDDPATPPSICLDPRSIALPSQPATFLLLDTPIAGPGYDVSKQP